ncbi:hypothetical protein ERO13_A06G039833v2 [Gossypium hirsutum]|nr:hypothetical protein ERO13_A06G039833v2 [Gossypium hirsutum]
MLPPCPLYFGGRRCVNGGQILPTEATTIEIWYGACAGTWREAYRGERGSRTVLGAAVRFG